MSHTKSNVWLMVIAGLVGIAVMLGIWWATNDLFYALTKDDLRAAIVSGSFALAILLFGTWIFTADDQRTFELTKLVTFIYIILGGLFAIAGVALKDANGNISNVNELIQPVISGLIWILPVLTGAVAFIVSALDRAWGVDTARRPVIGKQPTGKPSLITRAFLILVTGVALLGSALGTGEAYMILSKSLPHSLVVVGTVEVTILAFMIWAHQTLDRDIFKYTIGVAIFFFLIAMIFQLVDSSLRSIGGQVNNDSVNAFARNFVLLPPILTGIIGLFVMVENQRKKFVPLEGVQGARPSITVFDRPTASLPVPTQQALPRPSAREQIRMLGPIGPDKAWELLKSGGRLDDRVDKESFVRMYREIFAKNGTPSNPSRSRPRQ